VAPPRQRGRSSKEDPHFVERFFASSRLHFIGSWRRRYATLLAALPPPPPLPAPFPCTCSTSTVCVGHRIILLVDMDAFFAAVAVRENPRLKGKPVAVCWGGGNSAEVSSCTYEARALGVKKGMWLQQARRLCPSLVLAPYNFDAYHAAGESLLRALRNISPHTDAVSCDEMFVDVTHVISGNGDVDAAGEALAIRVRSAVAEATGGLPCSVGVGPNRMLAKLAATRAKPPASGVHVITANGAIDALGDGVSARDLPGVGRSTAEALLKHFNATTVVDLRAISEARLAARFGPKISKSLYLASRGCDPRAGAAISAGGGGGEGSNAEAALGKSVGAQVSWGVRMDTVDQVHDFIDKLAAEAAGRLVLYGDAAGPNEAPPVLHRREARTVSLRVWRAVKSAPESMRKGMLGHGVCDIIQRSVTTTTALRSSMAVAEHVRRLWTALRIPPEEVRGLGVHLSRLEASSSSSSWNFDDAATATAAKSIKQFFRGTAAAEDATFVGDPEAAAAAWNAIDSGDVLCNASVVFFTR